METKFRNTQGLTPYAFACGHVERKLKNGQWKEMYMEYEHLHIRSGNDGEKWNVWETFHINELTKARKFYKSIKLNKIKCKFCILCNYCGWVNLKTELERSAEDDPSCTKCGMP